jgi:hypothetical protein
MRTIEQAAKEHADKTLYLSDFPHHHPSEISGFKAGVEFAQRWISVVDGLPKHGEFVIAKYGNGFIEAVRFACFTKRVTHWRRVEVE